MTKGKRYMKPPFPWGRLILLLVVTAVLSAVAYGGFYALRAQQVLEGMKREDLLPVPVSTQEAPQDPAQGRSLNFLLLGSDSREVGQERGRSDTLMLAHLPADRSELYLISFPRDIYVSIPGEGKNKINHAYSAGGSPLTVRTVENLLKTKVDHVALVDFQSFTSLVGALGGVTIDNPYEACDTSQGVCWQAGEQRLTEEKALQYVRWRYGLPNGDVTRTLNQQRVVKAILKEALAGGGLTDLPKLTGLLETGSKHVVVDKTLTTPYLQELLLSTRITSSESIHTLTFPITGYTKVEGIGDVDKVDEERLLKLQKALAEDDLRSYWREHGSDPVAGLATVPDPGAPAVTPKSSVASTATPLPQGKK